MNLEAVEKVARAVLYEGFMLYPYTAESVKNRQRVNFGVLYPPGVDTSEMQTECLALAGNFGQMSGFRSESPLFSAEIPAKMSGISMLDVLVRFLEDGGETEREVRVSLPLGGAPVSQPFAFGALSGEVEARSTPVREGIWRVTVPIRNRSAAARMLSTHTILVLRGGEFVSLMDPPEDLRAESGACRNIGTWPVLAGAPGERDVMLSSPIILYDYPQVAPESPQDLFDATEIDEILTLRILTLSDNEKAEIRAAGGRARDVLERCERLTPEQMSKLHGAIRELRPLPPYGLRAGDRVRLRPRPGGDVLDIALAGKVGIIESIERDFEERVHLAVVLEDDPGRDLGLLRQPGHRFFFSLEEVEPVV
jgi:hypothetical protein